MTKAKTGSVPVRLTVGRGDEDDNDVPRFWVIIAPLITGNYLQCVMGYVCGETGALLILHPTGKDSAGNVTT